LPLQQQGNTKPTKLWKKSSANAAGVTRTARSTHSATA
jgi:hypothetical protein